MDRVTDLLSRPTYGLGQVDRLLGLPGGTARRWIDGYTRAGKQYPPVIREEATGNDIATWGEFVETRLLSEYRDAGVPLIRMRPAIEALREELATPYPLASARTWLAVEGRDLVRTVQERVGLEERLLLVVVRNGQLLSWSDEANDFLDSVEWSDGGNDETARHPARLRLVQDAPQVVIDPLRGFGEPVVRNVRTEVLAELARAGEDLGSLADLYQLPIEDIEAAIAFEEQRAA